MESKILRSRLILLGVALVFIIPILVSWYLVFFSDFKKGDEGTQKGELISPVIPLGEPEVFNLKSKTIESINGKCTLLFFVEIECNQLCEDKLYQLHPLYHDCQVVQCKQCCSQWFVCQQHNKRFNVQNIAKLRNHFINDHLNTYGQDCDNSGDDGEIGLCLTNVCDSDSDDDISHNLYKKAKLDIDSDTTNDQYRNPNQPYTSPRILNDIIGTAFSNESICPLNVSTSEIAFHLNITNFCCSLSESQQYQLTEIIHQLQSNHCIATRTPTSYQDLQKVYLSGKHAINNNIPCPSVDQFDPHANC